jgi:HlyD family secretion protein
MHHRRNPIAVFRLQALAVMACLFALVAGCNKKPKDTNVAPDNSEHPVGALGRIEPVDGIISVSIPVGDRLAEILVKEGDTVKAGKVLASLASAALHQKEKKLAETQVREALERLQAIKENGARQLEEAELRQKRVERDLKTDIEILNSKLVILKKQAEASNLALSRITPLPPGSVPEQEVDRQKLAAEQAEAEYQNTVKLRDKAEASVKSAKAEAEAQVKTLHSTIEQARSQVPLASAEQQLVLAEERLKLSTVYAPSSGIILAVVARPGEVGGARPLLRMANTKELAVVAEVDESEALKIQFGQRATIKSKALTSLAAFPLNEKPLGGKVVWISPLVERNQVNALNPAALSDRRIVEVKVVLEFDTYGDDREKVHQAVARLLNLQVQVDIDLKTPAGK